MKWRAEMGGALLLSWMLLASLFIARSPADAFSHDMQGHAQHTQILYRMRRLALPREGWETYQPPLYYAISTLFTPDRPSHIFQIRLISVLYGSLTLLLMSRLLWRCGIPFPTQAMVLSFFATTPAFFFLFTTYNNDSLATLFSTGLLVATSEWFYDGRRRWIVLLSALATAGLYTKLSVLFTVAAITAIVGGLAVFRILPFRKILPVLAAFTISIFLLMPWLIGHNYRLTGRFTPVPADFPLFHDIRLPSTPLRTFLTPPGWTSGEWKDPYVRVWEKTHHKKNSYLAFTFVTSIFDEYTFEFLPPIIPWAILIIHAGLWMAAVIRARQSRYGPLALACMGLGLLGLATLIFRAPYATLMDFRYIAWAWLPGAVLFATVLVPLHPSSAKHPFQLTSFFRAAMISGTCLQGLLWITLLIGGRWNIP